MTEATSLDEKRAQLDQKLAALKISPAAADLVRKADQAVAAHRAEADALERALAEVDGQLGVRELDKREAAARQRQERWQTQRKRLLEEEEIRLESIADAEAATRALVKAVNDILATNVRMAKIAQELSANGKAPSACNPMELVNRMAGRIASVMATVKGHPYRLGPLEWPGGASALYPANGPAWRESEGSMMAKQLLQPLLEKGEA